MAFATFGLVLVGKQLYQRRLRGRFVAMAREVIDAAGIYLDGHGEARNTSNGVHRGRRRTWSRKSGRVVESGSSGVETDSRAKNRRVGPEARGCDSPPELGADLKMDDPDPAAPGMTEDQAQRQKDLEERHAKYTERLARREAAFLARDEQWLEADEASHIVQEALDQAQATFDKARAALDQSQQTFHHSREDLAIAERKWKKAKGSWDLVIQRIQDVERQQEKLEAEILVDWE